MKEHKCDGCEYKGEHQEMMFGPMGVCHREHNLVEAVKAFNAEECPYKNNTWIVSENGCVINCPKCGEKLELCYPDGTKVRYLPHCPWCGKKLEKRNDLLELINRVECFAGREPLYYFPPHSLINLAIDYFKNSDVVVIDLKNRKQYQRGKAIKTNF